MRHHLTLLFILFATLAEACNVPVFRYALERWEPDPFQLVVFHDQPLPSELEQKLKSLEPVMEAPDARPNWKVTLVDTTRKIPALWAGLWEKERSRPLPSYALCTPEWTKDDDALHSGQLTLESIQALVTSAKRSEILDSILKGTAVTWLVVETKDADANQKLHDLLASETKRLLDVIQIPPNIGKDGINVLSPLPVEVSFRIITLSANDPAEAMLLHLLNNGEMVKEPTLYPVFGRGRVLAAMPSSSLNKELLEETARFLCGACSCQVKAQNPGFDLLLSAHWQSLFGDNAPPHPMTEPKAADKPVLVPIPGRKKPQS